MHACTHRYDLEGTILTYFTYVYIHTYIHRYDLEGTILTYFTYLYIHTYIHRYDLEGTILKRRHAELTEALSRAEAERPPDEATLGVEAAEAARKAAEKARARLRKRLEETDTYIHTYIRTYVRTCMHTYIHTGACSPSEAPRGDGCTDVGAAARWRRGPRLLHLERPRLQP